MIAEGIYKAKTLTKKDSWGLTKAKTGNFQFFLKVQVTGPAEEGADEIDESAGPLIRTIYMPITPKTTDRVLGDLKSIGYDRPTLKGAILTPGTPESFAFGERDVLVKCEHNDFNNRVSEKWQLYKEREKLGGEDLSQFDSLFDSPADGPDGGN